MLAVTVLVAVVQYRARYRPATLGCSPGVRGSGGVSVSFAEAGTSCVFGALL